jgi:hypothetical protein
MQGVVPSGPERAQFEGEVKLFKGTFPLGSEGNLAMVLAMAFQFFRRGLGWTGEGCLELFDREILIAFAMLSQMGPGFTSLFRAFLEPQLASPR